MQLCLIDTVRNSLYQCVVCGDDVEEAFKTRDMDELSITISKNDVKRSGRKKAKLYVKNMPWLTYLNKGDKVEMGLDFSPYGFA